MGQDIVPDHELFKNADPGEMTLGSLHKDRPDLASVDLDDMPDLDDGQATVSIDDSDIQDVLDGSSASEEFRLPELDELNHTSDTGADALSLAEADKSQEINLDDLGDLQSESSMLSGMKNKLGNLSDKTKAVGAAAVGGVAAAGAAAKNKVSDLGSDDEGDFTLADMESEFTDMSSGVDHIATKLDLAKAYLDMGDEEGAREALNEVIAQGSTEQQDEAKKLLDTIA
jgi:pilus assembly protein FimV